MSLSNHELAARARGEKTRKINWLCRRLDSYVTLGERMKRGSRGRSEWLAKADDALAKIKELEG